jgi:hypothetical protein
MALHRTPLGRRVIWLAALCLAPTIWPTSTLAAPGPGEPPGSFAYRWSTDGGSTFTAAQLDDRGRDLTTTQLVVEGGVVHATFEDESKTGPGATNDRSVYYRRSTDGGRSFSGSVRIDNSNGDSSESDLDAAGSDVFVVWEDDRLLDNGDPDPSVGDLPPGAVESTYENRDDVLFTRSGDGGGNFDRPVNLSCEAEPRSPGEASIEDPTPAAKPCASDEVHNRDPRIAATRDGRRVVVAYEGTDVITGPESAGDFTVADDIFLSVSDDGGRTWPVRNVNVTNAPERQNSPAVAVSDSAVHLVFENKKDDLASAANKSIQYTRSLDGGRTFEPVRSLPGSNAVTAAIRADGATVHVFGCEDDATEAQQGKSKWDLLYWRSADHGETWSKPETLASHAEGCGDPDVDLAGESVHLVYESEADPLESDIFYVRSDDQGKKWTKRVNLSNNALAASGHPVVAADAATPGNVYIGWSDEANLLMSVAGVESLPGDDGVPLAVADEDVVRYRGGTYSMVLDGSDVGLDGVAIDALARLGEREFVLSFAQPTPLGSLGLVEEGDLVRFTADRLGPDTAGTFDLYFDGSDIGLADSGIDAVEVLPNGGGVDLYLSTTDSFAVGGVKGSASDVFVCTAATTGEGSGCGGVVAAFEGPSGKAGRVDAFSFDGVGIQDGEDAVAYFSFAGSFDAKTASGDGSDVVLCAFDNLPAGSDGRILHDCGSKVPLRSGLEGRYNGITGEITALEFDY